MAKPANGAAELYVSKQDQGQGPAAGLRWLRELAWATVDRPAEDRR